MTEEIAAAGLPREVLSKRWRILLAEDEPVQSLLFFQRTLAGQGYVRSTRSLQAAKHWTGFYAATAGFTSCHYGLGHAPGLDGAELCRRIRDAQLPGISLHSDGDLAFSSVSGSDLWP